MAWTAPTLQDFSNRFPEFADVADGTVQVILDEATGDVGPEWVERDRTPGVLHLAAHLLASQGLGVASAGDGRAAVSGAIKRRRVGDVETEYAGLGSSTGSGPLAQYSTTAYGQRFLALARRNFPAVAVVV
jgi:hypothetical protein